MHNNFLDVIGGRKVKIPSGFVYVSIFLNKGNFAKLIKSTRSLKLIKLIYSEVPSQFTMLTLIKANLPFNILSHFLRT